MKYLPQIKYLNSPNEIMRINTNATIVIQQRTLIVEKTKKVSFLSCYCIYVVVAFAWRWKEEITTNWLDCEWQKRSASEIIRRNNNNKEQNTLVSSTAYTQHTCTGEPSSFWLFCSLLLLLRRFLLSIAMQMQQQSK